MLALDLSPEAPPTQHFILIGIGLGIIIGCYRVIKPWLKGPARKHAIGVIIVSVLIGLGGATGLILWKNRTLPPVPFTSADGAVSLTIPGNWSQLPAQEPDMLFCIGDLGKRQYLKAVTIPKGTDNVPLEDRAKIVTAGLSRKVPGFSDEGTRTLRVGGFPAIQFHFTSTDAGGAVTVFSMTLVETDGALYEFTAWTLGKYRETALPVVEQVVAGASFHKPR